MYKNYIKYWVNCVGLTVLWASGTHSNLSKSLIFDFIYKRYIDETVCITPVYLKISEKTREEKCGSLSIVKSMQNSQKRKQIQVRSCKGLLLLMFSKPPNPQWPVKMNTLTFRGKKYYFASWFFPVMSFVFRVPHSPGLDLFIHSYHRKSLVHDGST